MKDKPILMSTPMVRAILDGSKTQTRRLMKPQPRDHDHQSFWGAEWENEPPHYVIRGKDCFCSLCGDGIGIDGRSLYKAKYEVGDILWVRETYAIKPTIDPEQDWTTYLYKASHELDGYDTKWRPSIFMPKDACRIRLQVTDIRVERLQDISEEDAIAEGIDKVADYGSTGYRLYTEPNAAYADIDAVSSYESLWESINGKGSWDKNPWVWVIAFKRI